MKLRSRAEQEIMRNINETSLEEIYLLSPADRNTTNAILGKILNRWHHLDATREASTCSPIVKMSAAA